MEVGHLLVYVFLMLFGIFFSSYFITYSVTLDTTTWTFIGHELISMMLPYMGWIFLMIVILVPVFFIVKELKL